MDFDSLKEPALVGTVTGILHGAAHYTFGNPSSFQAAAVSEVGMVVFAASAGTVYLYHQAL